MYRTDGDELGNAAYELTFVKREGHGKEIAAG